MASSKRHPMQPVVVAKDRVHRFKANAIVQHLLDRCRDVGVDMNSIALQGFSREDQEQFAQLIGYSVSGACGLSYMSNRVCQEAIRQSEEIAKRRGGRRRTAIDGTRALRPRGKR